MGVAVTIEVKGLGEAQAFASALGDAADVKVVRQMKRAGQIVRTFWMRNLSGPASFRRLGVRTGTLRRSIQVDETAPGVVSVGSPVRYARIHEFGFRGVIATRNGPRRMNMPERPHRAPTLKQSDRPLTLWFNGQTDQAIRLADLKSKAMRSTSKEVLGTMQKFGISGRRG